MVKVEQKEIEIILMRQLASYLDMPVFLVDPAGNLIFYNERAERILGRRFEETGEMPASEWGTVFEPRDDSGRIVPPEDLPLMIAISEKRPAYRAFRIRGLDGVDRSLQVTAFPLVGLQGRHLGAAALFWESSA
jgi:PAS domain-containing protein